VRTKFTRHKAPQRAVIRNEHWYGDGAPKIGKKFTSKDANDRANACQKILRHAWKRAKKGKDSSLAARYATLRKKIAACSPRKRCGSLACPPCARAFQKTATLAQRRMIKELGAKRGKKQLVWVCLIPPGPQFKFTAGQLSNMDVVKANRWLKDQFRALGMTRVILGNADLGWRKRGNWQYLQVHWHLVMWTSNPGLLRKKLQRKFRTPKLPRLRTRLPGTQRYERPVHVQVPRDLHFLPYQSKVIQLPELLRKNRSTLAELLLRLDEIEPLDSIVLSRLRIVSTANGFRLKSIPRC
jgi:hypothetical protein